MTKNRKKEMHNVSNWGYVSETMLNDCLIDDVIIDSKYCKNILGTKDTQID